VNFVEETVAKKARPTITALTQDKSHDKTRHETTRQDEKDIRRQKKKAHTRIRKIE
jgi:hypothetical protein